jgi:aldose sugar dehydrogenase
LRLLPLLLARSALLLCCLVAACAPATPSSPQAAPKQEATAGPVAGSVSDDDDDDGSAAAPVGPTPTSRPLARGLKTELVADGLQLPANLAFAPDGRLFLTEVTRGTVRVVDRGTLLSEPFATLEVSGRGEQGLLGLALDPDFARTRYVYLYHSQLGEKGGRNRVVRLTDAGGSGTDLQVLLDNLPIGTKHHNAGHNGGRLAFGPDGKLYVTVGDTGDTMTAQDKGKLSGKLLRINPDGSIPADNPFGGSPVYAYGLRNSYGLGFHPISGVPYVTDNGPRGHDEVNRIRAGGNYGSPEVNGIRRNKRFVDPIWESGADRAGISGLAFYTGRLFPDYRDDLLFCSFTRGHLVRLRLAGADDDDVVKEELLSNECNLDVATGPEGAIYFTSITKVQRLVPAH